MLRFSDIPLMSLRVSDNIDAVIWVNMLRQYRHCFDLIAWSGIPLERHSFQLKNISVGRTVFVHAPLSSLFKTVMEEITAHFIMSAYQMFISKFICVVYINVGS